MLGQVFVGEGQQLRDVGNVHVRHDFHPLLLLLEAHAEHSVAFQRENFRFDLGQGKFTGGWVFRLLTRGCRCGLYCRQFGKGRQFGLTHGGGRRGSGNFSRGVLLTEPVTASGGAQSKNQGNHEAIFHRLIG